MHRDNMTTAPIPSGWLDQMEAAAYMKCTEGYVRRLCRRRQIPFSLCGKKFILSKRDCDAHMKRVRVPIFSEPDS
jgi:excisionase family DNA binding protein